MKVNPPAGIGPRRAVFQVPLDVTPDGGKLGPDLVVAPGVQLDLQQVVALQAQKETIREARLLCIVAGAGNHERLVQRLVSPQPVYQRIGVPGRSLRHKGPVGFFHAAFTEERAQPLERLFRAGKEHHAARGTIQPVRDPDEDVSLLPVFFLQVVTDLVGQRTVAGLVALHNVGRKLVDGNEVIVFVQDAEIVGLRHGPDGIARMTGNGNRRARGTGPAGFALRGITRSFIARSDCVGRSLAGSVKGRGIPPSGDCRLVRIAFIGELR